MKKKSVLQWFLFSLCMIFCTIDTLYEGQKEKDVVNRKNHVFFYANHSNNISILLHPMYSKHYVVCLR